MLLTNPRAGDSVICRPPLHAGLASAVQSPASACAVMNIGERSGRRGDGFCILVAEKEKQLVLLDRSTDHAAKLIALQLVHRRRKCVPRIQISVAEEFKGSAVEIVGARFRHHFDRARRVLPVLGRHGTGLHLELLQRVGERQRHCAVDVRLIVRSAIQHIRQGVRLPARRRK